MPSNLNRQRTSPRKVGHEYSQSGTYFVTICTHNMIPWFGTIQQCRPQYTQMGRIAVESWIDLPNHYHDISLDEFIVMPNHVHGIIILSDAHTKLGTVVGSYKAAVTRRIRRECDDYPETIWQGRYHDRIVRNTEELQRIQLYIINNPARWNNGDQSP
jgi:putative transposase